MVRSSHFFLCLTTVWYLALWSAKSFHWLVRHEDALITGLLFQPQPCSPIFAVLCDEWRLQTHACFALPTTVGSAIGETTGFCKHAERRASPTHHPRPRCEHFCIPTVPGHYIGKSWFLPAVFQLTYPVTMYYLWDPGFWHLALLPHRSCNPAPGLKNTNPYRLSTL